MSRLWAGAVLVLVCGCGSDDGNQSRWAKAANAACLETLAEVEAIPEPATDEEAAAVFKRYNEAGQKLDAKLRLLRPAPDERERARKMIAAYAAVLPVQEQMADALRREDGDRFDELEGRMRELGSEGDRLALELGADECAKEAFDEDPDAGVG